MAKKLDLTGKRFGKLVVESPDVKKHGRTYWICRCDCGNIISAQTSNLNEGKIQSCKCLRTKQVRERCWKGVGDLSGSHWNQIKTSALGRKIPLKISKKYAWELFLEQKGKCWLTKEPIILSKCKKELEQTASLDRIDSSKGYVKGNVCWVHKIVQKMKMDLPLSDFVVWCEKIRNVAVDRL